MGWIKQKRDKPFFAYIATNAPHGPFIAPEEYKEMYRKFCPKEAGAAFFGMITNIDDNMGLLMKKLDEWDMADDTILIFMTDNGTALGRRFYNAGMKGAKGTVNEGGCRVPLFVRWPGKIAAGRDVDTLTRHYDLYPTLAGVAGAKIPEGYAIDGRSLLPLLENREDVEWGDRYLFFHQGRWNKEGAPGRWGRGIRIRC